MILIITAIVLNYNNYEDSIECVDNLLGLNSFEKIILVDNASKDLSFRKFMDRYSNSKNVAILKSDKNNGYAAGNNIGLKFAIEKLSSDFVMICNPDVRIYDNKAIESMKKTLALSQNISAVAPTMLNSNGEKIINAWKLPSFTDDLFLSFSIIGNLIWNPTNYSESYINSSDKIKVEVLSGSCFMIKSDIILNVGYLDDNTFLYGEERILGKQMKRIGYSQILLKNYFFYHYHGTTISKNIKNGIKRYKILSDSRYYYQVKYNNINLFQKVIFKIAIILGLIEQLGIKLLKNIIKALKIR